MSLEFTREFCVITIKNDDKFEEKLSGQFKIDIKDWTKFGQSTQKCQKFAL